MINYYSSTGEEHQYLIIHYLCHLSSYGSRGGTGANPRWHWAGGRIQDGSSVHHRAKIQRQTTVHTYGKFRVSNQPGPWFLVCGRKPEKTHKDTGRTYRTHCRPLPNWDLNQEPSCCTATAPPWCPSWIYRCFYFNFINCWCFYSFQSWCFKPLNHGFDFFFHHCLLIWDTGGLYCNKPIRAIKMGSRGCTCLGNGASLREIYHYACVCIAAPSVKHQVLACAEHKKTWTKWVGGKTDNLKGRIKRALQGLQWLRAK